MDRFPPDPPPSPTFSSSSPQPPPVPPPSQSSLRSSDEPDSFKISFLKGPKRKRLAKACDACHKSKRRCDGTAPCSNCYFAAKDCTYTDSSGRPVPAPVASTDKPSRPGPSQPRRRSHKEPSLESPVSPATSTLPFKRTEPLTSLQDPSDARHDYAESSKRPRVGSISSLPAPESQALIPPTPLSTFVAIRLEVLVVRELVNLFFAHCHPHCLIFHQPTFMADVCLGRIPSYLLHALCALAAPFSKSPVVRTDSPRTAGSLYAKTAEELMFDSHGRLSVDRNLVAVQALCLLETHQSILSSPWPSSSTYHQLALSILSEDLHIQDEYHSNLASAPTTSFELDAIGRECAQRAFWYIRLMHWTTFAYFHIPEQPTPMDLHLRLPVDEASFEFGRHNSQSEYLHLPAPRTPFVSEFGHLLRIASMHGRLEATISAVSSRHDAANAVIEETEKEVSAWESSLTDHVRFSEESAAFHLSMFETNSNTGAWCFFMMHTVYAWCVLILSEAKSRGSSTVANSCRDRLLLIGTKLGHRAKNSVLVVAVILALSRFGMSDHPQVVTWAREYADACGMDPPTKNAGKLPMPIAEVLSFPRRPTLPPLPPTPAPSTGVDRLEDRSETSSTGSSGTYFNSLRSSYNKLRITNSEPAAPGPALSLPSLKSCGLLESRPYQRQPSSSSQRPPDGGTSEHPASPTPPWIALRKANAPKESVPGSSEPTPSPTAMSRSSSKPTMPVGLHWLANEP